MKPPIRFACSLAVTAVLFLGLVFPLVAQTPPPPRAARSLHLDLKAIPSGSQPTEAQVQALSADLGALLPPVEQQPTATLDYLALKLADATAQGQFGAEDLRAVAHNLTLLLSGNSFVSGKVSSVQSILRKAGAERDGIKQLAEALRTLPTTFSYNFGGDSTSVQLTNLSAGSRGYLHSNGSIFLSIYRGPVFAENGDATPAQLTQSLGVDVSQVPRGKYHVSVTTKNSNQPVDLGAFRVRDGVIFMAVGASTTGNNLSTDAAAAGDADTDGADDGSDDPATPDSNIVIPTVVPIGGPIGNPILTPPDYREGFVSFGTASYNRPLPAGLSLADIVGVAVTDEQGLQRFTGSLVDPDTRQTTHSLSLHFVAGAAAPTARGQVTITALHDASDQTKNFVLTVVGLPANAALTLSVNGKPVEQVMTGPTGRLLVEATAKPAQKTQVVNLLPDTVDLFSADLFVVSDAQGNILASAGF